jgi:hypothetical protein
MQSQKLFATENTEITERVRRPFEKPRVFSVISVFSVAKNAFDSLHQRIGETT